MKEFYTCLVEGTDGGYSFHHPTYDEARAEAARLANLPQCKGKKVYVLQAIAACVAPENPVEWLPFDQMEVPF